MLEGKTQDKRSDASKDCPVILHISDLHFGNDDTQAGYDRKWVLGKLEEKLTSDISTDWSPSYICITGDIGYCGYPDDYQAAKKWLVQFLKALHVDVTSVFMCPGNHDVDRRVAKKYAKPGDAYVADDTLAVPLSSHFNNIFANYISFQSDMGIPQYSIDEDRSIGSYLYGVRTTSHGLRFICCNSAWYSTKESEFGSLWLGAPILRSLATMNLICRNKDSETIDIALIHHPKEYFAGSEVYTWENSRAATFDYLARMSHVILMGHTHNKLRAWDQNEHEAYLCGGGASWTDLGHPNSFRLIRVNLKEPVYSYRSFEWNASANEWSEVLKVCYRLSHKKLAELTTTIDQTQNVSKAKDIPLTYIGLPQARGETDYESGIAANAKVPDVPQGYSLNMDRSDDVNKITRSLIEEMRRYVLCDDYDRARLCWNDNSGWFDRNKGSITKELADELEFLGQEIGFIVRQNDTK